MTAREATPAEKETTFRVLCKVYNWSHPVAGYATKAQQKVGTGSLYGLPLLGHLPALDAAFDGAEVEVTIRLVKKGKKPDWRGYNETHKR